MSRRDPFRLGRDSARANATLTRRPLVASAGGSYNERRERTWHMPIYTYRCSECGTQFERQQSFSEPSLRTCPKCGEEGLSKVYTPVGVVFKGSGFYSTDHRSSSGRSDSKNGKSEPKPAAKPGAASKPTSDAGPSASTPSSKED